MIQTVTECAIQPTSRGGVKEGNRKEKTIAKLTLVHAWTHTKYALAATKYNQDTSKYLVYVLVVLTIDRRIVRLTTRGRCAVVRFVSIPAA
jgi:hypothetical protein